MAAGSAHISAVGIKSSSEVVFDETAVVAFNYTHPGSNATVVVESMANARVRLSKGASHAMALAAIGFLAPQPFLAWSFWRAAKGLGDEGP